MRRSERPPWPVCPVCGGDECIHWLGWTTDGKALVTAFLDQLPGLVPIGSKLVNTGVSCRVYHEAGRAGLGDKCLAGGVCRRESGEEDTP